MKLDTFCGAAYSGGMADKTTFKDLYSFPGFRARATLKPHPKDPDGRIVRLDRRQKKQCALAAAKRFAVFAIAELMWCGIWMLELPASTLSSHIDELPVHTAKP